MEYISLLKENQGINIYDVLGNYIPSVEKLIFETDEGINIFGVDDNFDISHDSYIEFENRIENEIASWHYYDEILFNLYIDSGMSIRKLAKETRISEKSIFVTLKKCKNKLKKYDKK
jgi:hypothetical protein